MYRAGLEWILGFRVRAGTLVLTPNIPADWPRFEIFFRHASARYEILIENPDRVGRGVARVELDGIRLAAGEGAIPLADDNRTHKICVTLGAPPDRPDDRAAQRPAQAASAAGGASGS
jgi:cyclic beta-1,2-glucan synthetase